MDYIKKLRSIVGNIPLLLPGTAVVLLNKNFQILLQLRADTDSWGMPGGYIEPGEDAEASARRELYEETGLTADHMKLLGVFSGPELYIRYPNGDEVCPLIITYITGICSGVLTPDLESKQLCFFYSNQLPANIVPPHRYILSKIAPDLKLYL